MAGRCGVGKVWGADAGCGDVGGFGVEDKGAGCGDEGCVGVYWEQCGGNSLRSSMDRTGPSGGSNPGSNPGGEAMSGAVVGCDYVRGLVVWMYEYLWGFF